MISQNQVNNFHILTVTAASLVGRPNEVSHIAELDALYRYEVNAGAIDNGISIIPALGVNAHWVRISDAVKSNLEAVVAPSITDDSASLYEVGSVWVDTATDTSYVCLDNSVGASVWSPTTGAGGPQSKYNATVAPAITDDSASLYEVGSTWVDVLTDSAYICVDSTVGAAVWNLIKDSNTFGEISIVQAALATTTNNFGDTHYNFDTEAFKQGTELSVVIGAANTGGKITGLKAGKLYRLEANIQGNSPVTGDTVFRFVDLTANAQIGSAWQPFSGNLNTAVGVLPSQVAYFKPTANSEVGVDAISGTVGEIGIRSTFSVTEIATQTTTTASITNNLAATTAPTVTDDSGSGYAVGSEWVNTASGSVYICVDATAGAAVWSQVDGAATGTQNNYIATAAPAVSDDNTAGYAVGSVWIDTSASVSYVCVNAATGASVWHQIDGTSAGPKNNFNTSAYPSTTDDSSSLYEIGSLWVNKSSRTSYICTRSTNNDAAWNQIDIPPGAQNNLAAIVDPTNTDDNSAGYISGSLWVNVVQKISYICVRSTLNAAVWNRIDSGGGVLDNLTATVAPTSSDGIGQGYSVGSRWLVASSSILYICVDNLGQSTWVPIESGMQKRGTKTSPFMLQDGIYNLDSSLNSPFIITMPTASNAQRRYQFNCTNVSTNVITFAVPTGEYLNGVLDGTEVASIDGQIIYITEVAPTLWVLKRLGESAGTPVSLHHAQAIANTFVATFSGGLLNTASTTVNDPFGLAAAQGFTIAQDGVYRLSASVQTLFPGVSYSIVEGANTVAVTYADIMGDVAAVEWVGSLTAGTVVNLVSSTQLDTPTRVSFMVQQIPSSTTIITESYAMATTERVTNRTWIDGKSIYEMVIQSQNNLAITSTTTFTAMISELLPQSSFLGRLSKTASTGEYLYTGGTNANSVDVKILTSSANVFNGCSIIVSGKALQFGFNAVLYYTK